MRSAALAALTIAIGLLVHLGGGGLGPVFRDMLGDALWAAMIFWLLGVIMPGMRVVARCAAAYAVCVLVELSQLFHSTGLDALRETRLGGLILGSGFDPRDLLSYALGVGAAALIDIAIVRNGPDSSKA